MKSLRTTLVLLGLVALPTVSLGYVINNWWPDGDNIVMDEVFLPAATWSAPAQFQMSEWNELDTTDNSHPFRINLNPQFSFGANDGDNTIGFLGEAALNNQYGLSFASALAWAVCYSNFFSGRYDECDVILDVDRPWALGPDNDEWFQSTVLHELGHVRGLGHENDLVSMMNSGQSKYLRDEVLYMDDLVGVRQVASFVSGLDIAIYSKWHDGTAPQWMTMSPTTLREFQTINLNNIYVENRGTGAFGSLRFGTYLSTNTVISTGDQLLNAGTYSSFPTYALNTFNWSATIPSVSDCGTRYIGGIIDDINAYGERYEGNNSTVFTNGLPFTGQSYTPTALTILLAQDAYEQNDSFATAATIPLPFFNSNLNLDADFENDYYRFTVPSGGTLTVSAFFTHANGDVDLQVLNSGGGVIGNSVGVVNNESITLTVAAGTYYARVFGVGGGSCNRYTLSTGFTAHTPTPTRTRTFTPTATRTPTPSSTPTPIPTGSCNVTPMLVGTANVNTGTAGTTLTTTVPAGGVAAGSTVLVGFTMDTTAGAVSCSDSAGNAYVVETSLTQATDLRSVVCAAYNVSAIAAGGFVRVTHPNTTGSRNMSVMKVSGLMPAPLDRKTSATGDSTAPSSGITALTTQADEFLYGLISHRGATSEYTPAGGFAVLGAVGSGGSQNRVTDPQWRTVGVIGQFAATGALNPDRAWGASILTLKCGSGPPPNTPTPTFTPTGGPSSTPSPTLTPTPTSGGGGTCNASVTTVGTANVNSGTAGTSLAASVGAGGVPAGNSVFVGFTTDQSAGAVGCSDSAGNAYTVEVDRNNGNDLRMVICAAYNVAALSAGQTVQVTHPNTSSARNMTVQTISGLAAAPLDRKASDVGTGTAPSSGLTALTTQADEVLYGVVGHRGNTVDFTAGIGFTLTGPVGSTTSANRSTEAEFRTVTATGQYAATGTLNPSRNWAAGILTLKCGSAAPPHTATPTATPTNTNPPTPSVTSTPTSGGGGACNANVTTVSTANVNSGTAGTSLAVTVGAGGVPAGNSIFVGFTTDQTAGAVSCSDSAGNPYSVEVDRNNGNDLRMVICAAYNVAALAAGQTVQVTHPNTSAARNMTVQTISGLAAAPLDQKASNVGTGTAPSSGLTAPTMQANEVLYGVVGHRGNTVDFTAGTGFTLIGPVGSTTSGNRSTEAEFSIVAATGQYAATGTLNPSRNWAAGILTLKCGSAAPPHTATPTATPTNTNPPTPSVTSTPTSGGGGACNANVTTVSTANVNSGTAGTSLAVTVGAGGVPAGNSIFVGFTTDQTAGAVSCSDTAGNAYTVEVDRNNGNDLRMVICAAYNVAALAAGQTVQVTHPNTSSARNMTVQRISGLSAAPLDRKTSDVGQSLAPSSGLTAATSQANEVLYGVIGHRGNTVDFTAGAGFALTGPVGSTTTANRSTEAEFRIVAATGQYAATGTLNPSRNWAAGILTLRCN